VGNPQKKRSATGLFISCQRRRLVAIEKTVAQQKKRVLQDSPLAPQ